MSKLLVAVIAFSTVSLAVGHEDLSLGLFVNNPKIKLLSNPAVKDAYPNDDTDYDGLLKALAALQAPITVDKVEQVLKKHAPKLAKRVQNGEDGFKKVIDSVQYPAAKHFLIMYRDAIEDYYLVGLPINEQAKDTKNLIQLANGLNDEEKKVVAEKLKEAFDAVVKALYDPSL
ncbi:hypothetical protein AAVH_29303 [Aphelenchoides avenae]|nr:hypothetical protein AAVH_29303 [Aphelenchus avenae]